ncbi:MAG TPA: hypothetical protein VNQ48_01435 [Microbacteriaceae bacterium]|nr:hypothetical protein [Microbacteriaceae bacterium]
MKTTRIAAKPVARIAGAAALAATALLGLSACSLVAPVATMIHYDPADGIGTDLGEVKVRDAQAIMGESGAINVYFYVVNSGEEQARLHVALGAGGTDGKAAITLAPEEATTVGGPDSDVAVLVERPTDASLGGLYPVYFQVGEAAGQQLLVPVLDAEARPFFEDYLP